MRTIICDIDGVIFPNEGQGACHQWSTHLKRLPGVKEKFDEWEKNGDYIILMTGRKESSRPHLISLLRANDLFWDKLIMGVGHGVRVLINDIKSNGSNSAIAFNMERNEGLESLRNIV